MCIDTRILGSGTAIAPRDNTHMDTIVGHWATRVTLARVLAALTSANHDISENVARAISIRTSIIINIGYSHLLQGGGQRTAFGGGSPSGHNKGGARTHIDRSRRQINRLSTNMIDIKRPYGYLNDYQALTQSW